GRGRIGVRRTHRAGGGRGVGPGPVGTDGCDRQRPGRVPWWHGERAGPLIWSGAAGGVPARRRLPGGGPDRAGRGDRARRTGVGRRLTVRLGGGPGAGRIPATRAGRPRRLRPRGRAAVVEGLAAPAA